LGFTQAVEDFAVQELVAELCVEAFAERWPAKSEQVS